MFGIQFYPTPPDLLREMLGMVDFARVTYVLEPSAGKGDIALAIQQRKLRVDCVEMDADLRAVLRGRGLAIVGEDFLDYTTHTRYDLIAMNPPFNAGAQHLLHALGLLSKGGQLVCVLNAQTIREAHTNVQLTLLDKLDEIGATITYVEKAFTEAERRTNVEVALIYADIPKAEEADVLKNLRENILHGDAAQDFGETRLAEGDMFRTLVRQYDFECRAGLLAIDNFLQLDQYIPRGSLKDRMIHMEVSYVADDGKISMQNRYLLGLRGKYWSTLFASREMQALFTREMRETYAGQLERFRHYDFTMRNIMQLKLDLSATLLESVDGAIIKLFDWLGYENSMEKNGNIHYYSGWKTNRAFRVGQKVIFAVWGLYDNRWKSWSAYKSFEVLSEIEKVFSYLDNGKTDGTSCTDLMQETFKSSSADYTGEWITCKYFAVSLKKKGSVHLRFLDADLLKRFNIFGANKRGFLPPSYGRKCYEDLQEEERSVVDSFEGKRAYERTVQDCAFYLGGVGLLGIGG